MMTTETRRVSLEWYFDTDQERETFVVDVTRRGALAIRHEPFQASDRPGYMSRAGAAPLGP
jgi:hypothetical protein